MNFIEIIPEGIENNQQGFDAVVPGANHRKASEEIEQQNTLRQTTRYGYFFNEHYFSVTESDHHGNWSTEQVIDVRFLNPRPSFQINLPIATISTSCLLFFMSFIGLYFLELDWRFAISPALVGLLFFTFVPRLSSIRMVWESHFGHAQILEMYHNLPNRFLFSQFVELLEQKINASQKSFNHKKSRLVEELKEHRRLLKSGLIDQQEYERAKNFILQEHEKLDE